MIIVHYIILSMLLMSIALVGMIINRRNLINLLMCLELLFLSISMNFVTFSRHFHDIEGQIMVFLILAVAASESAIALALMVLMYRKVHSVDTGKLRSMHG
ncbi:MAG: NADH-quinone oxidoreductase subunit NuoK [Pseudomonadota bacterium]|nr:NADH-quinone oxidoreductase subunit NuoK [Pseudomonadota bacterium]